MLDRLLVDAGVSFDQIVLSGHRFTPDSDIFDAAGLNGSTSALLFDPLAAQKRIEKLPWIERASVTRRLPDTVLIEVRERQAFALWRRSDALYLIDAGGRVLAQTDGLAFGELPVVAGEGAAPEAQRLVSTLVAFPEIARRVDVAERISQRRWRLKLKSGLLIELPAGPLALALERLDRLNGETGLLERDLVSIDLRLPDRMALRSRPAPARSVPARTSSL